jgi:hypothetical protein
MAENEEKRLSREETARELRHYAHDTLVGDSLLKTLKKVTGGTSWRECLLALADLIDTDDEPGGER